MNYDEDQANELWIEAACEHFEEALSQRNYGLCKDIIADVLDVGFKTEAQSMVEQMRETPVIQFAHQCKNEFHAEHLNVWGMCLTCGASNLSNLFHG